MSFNPKDHLMQLERKDRNGNVISSGDYLQVMWRIVWMREEHTDWSMENEMLQLGKTQRNVKVWEGGKSKVEKQDVDFALFRATIRDASGRVISTGHGSETSNDFGDFLEKAETKALGRALAAAGFGTQFTGGELDEGERIVDSPVPPQKKAPESDRDYTKMTPTAPEQPAAPAPQKAAPEPATAEQLAKIQELASTDEYAALKKKYGNALEKLSKARAAEAITKLEKKAGDAA